MGQVLQAITSEEAPRALGPYSQAIVAGELVYCAGQIAVDPATGQIGSGDIKEQTRRVLDNLAAVLRAAGSGLDRVTKTTVFLTDIAEFTAMNEVYAEKFGGHRPARSTIGVAALPRGSRIEVECIALRR